MGFDNLAKLALLLTFAGLSFRLGCRAVPFLRAGRLSRHNQSERRFVSVIPKAAGLAVLVRLVWAAMPGLGPFAWQITMAVAILSMTLGNTMALWQDNIRRMMAYSSIAHAGYLLIGLAVAFAAGNNLQDSWDGIAAMLFYLVRLCGCDHRHICDAGISRSTARRVENIDELAGLAAPGRPRPP